MKLSDFAAKLDDNLLCLCEKTAVDEAEDVLNEGMYFVECAELAIKSAKNAIFALNFFLKFETISADAVKNAGDDVRNAARVYDSSEYDGDGNSENMEKNALAFIRAVKTAMRRVMDGETNPDIKPGYGEKWTLQGNITGTLQMYLQSVTERADLIGGDEWRDVVHNAIMEA